MKTKPELSQNNELNFTFSLLDNVHRDFELAIKQGCYSKKALLNQLLSIEIERLNDALPAPVDASVKSHIRAKQNRGELKKSWKPQQVSLPEALVNRVQEVCQSKGVVRDAFVNRMIFLATAKRSTVETCFSLHEFNTCDYFSGRDDRVYTSTMERLTESLDPLWRLHFALAECEEPGWDEPGFLYRFKLFDSLIIKTQNPETTRSKEAEDQEARANVERSRRELKLWSMTCWAEPADMQVVEIDLNDF